MNGLTWWALHYLVLDDCFYCYLLFNVSLLVVLPGDDRLMRVVCAVIAVV